MASTFHVYFGPSGLAEPAPVTRRVGAADCFAALSEGFDDFLAMPTYPVFVGLFYGIAGIAIAALLFVGQRRPPHAPARRGFRHYRSVRRHRALRDEPPAGAGFACQMARRVRLCWDRRRSPSILAFGLLLFAIFAAWIWAADLLYVWLYGPNPPAAAGPFLRDVLTSDRGWTLIVVGGLVGFCFAALALCISVVSIPLMLDRDVGLVPASRLRCASRAPTRSPSRYGA